MCMEGVDNGGDLDGVSLLNGAIQVDIDAHFGLPTLLCPAVRRMTSALYCAEDDIQKIPFTAKFIPYHAFANRGETDMRVWVEKEV